MTKLTLTLITALCWSHAYASNYFVSANGDDHNNGRTKSTPWRSLKKLSEVEPFLVPGDSVLFERGSNFFGQLSVMRPGIYMGAYGSGPIPSFSGALELVNWTAVGATIWKADCPSGDSGPGDVFIDGGVQPIGRYPDTGYLSLSGSSPNVLAFSDTSLTFHDGYWNGAEVVVRSSRWTLDQLPIEIYLNKTFHASLAASYPLNKGVGYFIQKHLKTLNRHGEWFYDTRTKELFLYLNPGEKPTGHIISASVLNTGLVATNVRDVVIQDLAFKQFRMNGVSLKNCFEIRLEHVEISHSGMNGLEVMDCTNPRIEHNLITDSNNNGVEWHSNSGGVFAHNSIRRTGLYPGRGASGNGTYIALNIPASIQTSRELFENNTIDSTGYSAIDFRTGGIQIRNNQISQFCMTKDDGAGIYTWGNTLGENVIDGNKISWGIGSGEGTTNSREVFVSGIYIDDRSSNIIITKNLVLNCMTAGIFLHNATTITLSGNTLFDNGNSLSNKEKGQLYIKVDTLGTPGQLSALTVSQNKFIASGEVSYCIYLSASHKQDLRRLGSFNGNQFSAIRSDQAIAESYDQDGLCSAPDHFTVADWELATHYETGSSFDWLTSKGHFEIAGKNMITNGTMTAGVAGWVVWPEKSTLSQDLKKVDAGPSLKISIPRGDAGTLLYQSGIALNKDKVYRISFSVVALVPGKLELVPLMAQSPWAALGDYTCFSIDSTARTFTYFFRPETTCLNGRVNFKSNTTFWIDSISLNEVVTITTDGHWH